MKFNRDFVTNKIEVKMLEDVLKGEERDPRPYIEFSSESSSILKLNFITHFMQLFIFFKHSPIG